MAFIDHLTTWFSGKHRFGCCIALSLLVHALIALLRVSNTITLPAPTTKNTVRIIFAPVSKPKPVIQQPTVQPATRSHLPELSHIDILRSLPQNPELVEQPQPQTDTLKEELSKPNRIAVKVPSVKRATGKRVKVSRKPISQSKSMLASPSHLPTVTSIRVAHTQGITSLTPHLSTVTKIEHGIVSDAHRALANLRPTIGPATQTLGRNNSGRALKRDKLHIVDGKQSRRPQPVTVSPNSKIQDVAPQLHPNKLPMNQLPPPSTSLPNTMPVSINPNMAGQVSGARHSARLHHEGNLSSDIDRLSKTNLGDGNKGGNLRKGLGKTAQPKHLKIRHKDSSGEGSSGAPNLPTTPLPSGRRESEFGSNNTGQGKTAIGPIADGSGIGLRRRPGSGSRNAKKGAPLIGASDIAGAEDAMVVKDGQDGGTTTQGFMPSGDDGNIGSGTGRGFVKPLIGFWYNDNPTPKVRSYGRFTSKVGDRIDWATFTGPPAHTSKEEQIAFEWNPYEPTPLPSDRTAFINNHMRRPKPGVNPTFFSVRWTGKLLIPNDGLYTFFFDRLDDGGRLFIDRNDDGKLEPIIDAWYIQQANPAAKPVRLKKGLHDIVIQYCQGPEWCNSIIFSWACSGQFDKEIVRRAN